MKRDGKVKFFKKIELLDLNKTSRKFPYERKPAVRSIYDRATSAIKDKVKKIFRSNEKMKKFVRNTTRNIHKPSVAKPKLSISYIEEREIDKYIMVFFRKSIRELRDLLKKNHQISSGVKGDLVNRVAQAKVLGCLPNCPVCGGGKLRFNIQTGEYRCPGYMDDTTFRYCGFRTFSGIERTPWID